MAFHLLMIDDDRDLCRVKKAQLEQTGEFAVTVAHDADAGLRLARKQNPDLILLDVLMPDKTGFEVLEILKRDLATAAIPVVMFTGVDEDAAKLHAAEEYSEGYVTKTSDGSHLIATIRAVLSRRPTG